MAQFYPWSKFYFLLFKLIIIHYHTQKPTYLGSMGNCLSKKAEVPSSDVDSGDSLCFPPPPTVNSPTPPPPPPCPQIDPAALGN